MKRKTIQIEEELHKKVQETARKNNMTMAEFTTYCLVYFVNENIDPRKPTGMRELRDTFVTFIRTMEKNFLVPGKEFNQMATKELENLVHDVKAIKTKLNEK